jgi:ParB family protein of integrating conjugative element (PFGI_1 class)
MTNSTKKTSHEEHVRNRLVGALPSVGRKQDATITAPISSMQIVVKIDQLRPFKFNPRTSRNPRYEEIKASIRAVGLDHSPNITQLPGDDKFTVRDGGNTRLTILHELWEETGDTKFFEIKCVFKPFTNYISMIVGHLSENDNRGDLKWIERANSLKVARDAYLEQDGIETISHRDLVKRLESDGYKISRSHVVKMFQTINYILPSLPNLLMSGMGRPQVERVMSFRQAAKAIWDCCSLPEVEFDEEFHNILYKFDTDEHETLPFTAIHDSLLGMLVSKTNAHFNVIELTFDLITNSKNKPIDECLEALREELGIEPVVPKTAKNTPESAAVISTDNEPEARKADSVVKKTAPVNTPLRNVGDADERSGAENVSPDILRKEVGAAALKLAKWAGFDSRADGDGAISLSTEGCGYLLQPLDVSLDSVSLESQLVWQVLAGLTGSYNPEYPSDSTILGLILGTSPDSECKALPDDVLTGFFELVRLMRRLNSID